jgi:hypothetical protein
MRKILPLETMKRDLRTLRTLRTSRTSRTSSFGAGPSGPSLQDLPPDMVREIAARVNPYYNRPLPDRERLQPLADLKKFILVEQRRQNNCREILQQMRTILNRVHASILEGSQLANIRNFMNEIETEDMVYDYIPIDRFTSLWERLIRYGCLEELSQRIRVVLNPGDNIPIVMWILYVNRNNL